MKEKDNKSDTKEDYSNEIENDDLTFVESTEDGEPLPQKDKIKKIREELKICKKEKEEYLTGWQRAKADYINIQKEMEEVRRSSTLLAKENILEKLFPVLDSFEMAFNNKESWEKVDKEWRMGIEYIYQQLMNSLDSLDIQKINETNIPFDPKIHHSIEMIDTQDKNKDHLIAEVVQAGYKIKNSNTEKVIRAAGVNVFQYKD